ncbi:hypothetical protein NDU88_006366 [Pleurodeles waltl]|uniref:Uncharacterized protein n=1 Tax=Pleurodeles waltl TaxID=8319 RepID=A0AAV7MZ27_PLEWA|nr:hypothetical protein NDU88_006366 [Pleurodeles waltl]
MVAQVLPQIPEGVWDTLTQAVKDGRDAAKFTIRYGLDTTYSLGRAITLKVALRHHSWLHSTGFSGDAQSSLMDVPFDGSHLFGEKADSVLERFKDSRAKARSLGLSAPARQQSVFCPFRWIRKGCDTTPATTQPPSSGFTTSRERMWSWYRQTQRV